MSSKWITSKMICSNECTSSSSSDGSTDSEDADTSHDRHNVQHANTDDDDDQYSAEVRVWVRKVAIGLGLCPWAIKSSNGGLLRIVTCEANTSTDVANIIEKEIKSLLGEGTPPLSTTLIVCPHMTTWKEFEPFDEFVQSGIKQQLSDEDIVENVTLVAFHPQFLRWHGLPSEVGVGSTVQSHWGMIGQKSQQTANATIIETNNKAFGLRKVKVRFHDTVEGLGRKEQFVPTDWIDFTNVSSSPPPLPDNCMHRSPYPTIHIISNQDLASTSIRDVSRVKRFNAQRMAKLGWDGLERRLADND